MTGWSSSAKKPIEMQRTPPAPSGGTSIESITTGGCSTPSIRGIEKPHTSASMTATFRPRWASATDEVGGDRRLADAALARGDQQHPGGALGVGPDTLVGELVRHHAGVVPRLGQPALDVDGSGLVLKGEADPRVVVDDAAGLPERVGAEETSEEVDDLGLPGGGPGTIQPSSGSESDSNEVEPAPAGPTTSSTNTRARAEIVAFPRSRSVAGL